MTGHNFWLALQCPMRVYRSQVLGYDDTYKLFSLAAPAIIRTYSEGLLIWVMKVLK